MVSDMRRQLFAVDTASNAEFEVLLILRRAKCLDTLETMVAGLERKATSFADKDVINRAFCIRELEIDLAPLPHTVF